MVVEIAPQPVRRQTADCFFCGVIGGARTGGMRRAAWISSSERRSGCGAGAGSWIWFAVAPPLPLPPPFAGAAALRGGLSSVGRGGFDMPFSTVARRSSADMSATATAGFSSAAAAAVAAGAIGSLRCGCAGFRDRATAAGCSAGWSAGRSVATAGDALRRAGLDVPIAGGAHVLAFAQELVLQAWGIEALYHGAHVDVRFKAPVRAGARLVPRIEVTAVEGHLLTLGFELRSDDVRAAEGQIAIPLLRR